MLRVIDQEEARQQAWDLWTGGAGKKNEPFEHYLKRVGVRDYTPEPTEKTAASAARTVGTVRQRLGRFYKPPITA